MSAAPSDAAVAFLHAHGINLAPDAIPEMFRVAVERLRSNLRTDPQRELTAHEVKALKSGGLDLSAQEYGSNDPLAATAAAHAALLETGLTTRQAAELLKVRESRIRQRLTARPPTLYGLRVASEWRIPDFQFAHGRLVPGFAKVAAALRPGLHPVAVLNWFCNPNPDLPNPDDEESPLSPRDWLCLGFSPDPVADLARNL